MIKEIFIGVVIGLILGFFLFSNINSSTQQSFEDFKATAGETWNNNIPFRYTSQSCENWFISLNIGSEEELDYCFIKDFEIRDDFTPSTINCRCWIK